MKQFTLTDEIIRNGLTDEDLSRYAGYPVISPRFSDFPHWDELKTHGSLSLFHEMERTYAIYKKLLPYNNNIPSLFEANYLVDKQNKFLYLIKNVLESFSSAKSFSNNITPSGITAAVNMESPLYPFDHFQKILWQNVNAGINSTDEETESFIVPGILCEHVPIKRAFRKGAAFMCRYPSDMEAKEFWSLFSRTPVNRLSNVPNEGVHILLTDLHEMRHLVQVTLESQTHNDKDILKYYTEIDADLFARSVLDQAGIGEQICIGWMHSRYLNLLTSMPTHWIAPALEAFEAGQCPPDFYNIYRAVKEIRFRLAMQADSNPLQHIESDRLQAAIGAHYHHPDSKNSERIPTLNIGRLDRKFINLAVSCDRDGTFERLYTPLRQLVEKGVFTDELSSKIARRIVEAANYFNPDLTQDSALRPKTIVMQKPAPTAAP